MDALLAVLRPLANVMNRNIRATTPARALCGELDGKCVAVRVENTGLAARFDIRRDGLELSGSLPDEPDVLIEGSLLSLTQLAGESGAAAIRDGRVRLSGDAETAAQFQALLRLARPDIEEELSAVVGDAAAHRLGSIARDIGRWSRDARATMGANVREYLQEERRDVPSRYEVDRFATRVSVLRDDVERLEARLNRLQDKGR